MAVILTEENRFVAAGALIDEFTVLTAAHSVQDYSQTKYNYSQL